MNIVEYRAEHLMKLRLQPAQRYLAAWTTDDHAAAIQTGIDAGTGWAFSAIDGDHILGVAGVQLYWPGRGAAWSYLSSEIGAHFMQVHRAVMRFMEGSFVHRIEATVDDGFEEGHRWARMLGFRQETSAPMMGYRPDGGGCYLYARVR